MVVIYRVGDFVLFGSACFVDVVGVMGGYPFLSYVLIARHSAAVPLSPGLEADGNGG